MTDPLDTLDFDLPQTRRMLADAESMPLVEPNDREFVEQANYGGLCLSLLGVIVGIACGIVIVTEIVLK